MSKQTDESLTAEAAHYRCKTKEARANADASRRQLQELRLLDARETAARDYPEVTQEIIEEFCAAPDSPTDIVEFAKNLTHVIDRLQVAQGAIPLDPLSKAVLTARNQQCSSRRAQGNTIADAVERLKR